MLKNWGEIPIHHRRYGIAWALHQCPTCSEEGRLILEREMDDAQSHFLFFEFQIFKKTLPGYLEHWNDKMNALIDELARV